MRRQSQSKTCSSVNVSKILIAVAVSVSIQALIITLYAGYTLSGSNTRLDTTMPPVPANLNGHFPSIAYKRGLRANLTRKTVTIRRANKYEKETNDSGLTDVCYYPDPRNDKFSNFYNVLAAMRVLIPTTFHPKFKNPCWYSNFRIPYLKGKVKKFYNDSVPLYNLMKFNKLNESKTLHCLPYFYIAGFPRSGTTALFNLISHHPQFTEPAYKEVHWLTHSEFDPTFPNNLKSVMRYIYHFHAAAREIEQNANLVTCDASASTLWDVFFHSPNQISGCETPLLLSHILPGAKYVVLLRDPVERLYSEFWYRCKSDNRVQRLMRNGPRMFHKAVQNSLDLFVTCQLHYLPSQCLYLWQKEVERSHCDYVKLHTSLYYLHIIKWFSVIPRKQFLFIKSEDLFDDPQEVFKKLLEFLDLPPVSNHILLDNYLLKFTENSNQNVHEEYHNQRMTLLNETKTLLKNFFQPYNRKLANLLDQQFLWDNT